MICVLYRSLADLPNAHLLVSGNLNTNYVYVVIIVCLGLGFCIIICCTVNYVKRKRAMNLAAQQQASADVESHREDDNREPNLIVDPQEVELQSRNAPGEVPKVR